MTISCAIIVCDHGLGHLRRCAIEAKNRQEKGENVTLFAPLKSMERITRIFPSLNGLKILDFSTNTKLENYRHGLTAAIGWIKNIPNLDEFDLVICDNLPEILSLRPDAILYAQFFWHDIFQDLAKDYFYFCENLLAKYCPTIIGCDLFAMNQVKSQPRYKPVGLYFVPELLEAVKKKSLESRTDLLITGGSTKSAHLKIKEIINKILISGPKSFNYIHVDSELLPDDPPTWMIGADFSIEMYCRLKAAICRPGLGVLTDLLTVGVKPYLIYEPGNPEMEHNATVLEKHGLGKIIIDIHCLDKQKEFIPISIV